MKALLRGPEEFAGGGRSPSRAARREAAWIRDAQYEPGGRRRNWSRYSVRPAWSGQGYTGEENCRTIRDSADLHGRHDSRGDPARVRVRSKGAGGDSGGPSCRGRNGEWPCGHPASESGLPPRFLIGRLSQDRETGGEDRMFDGIAWSSADGDRNQDWL